MIKKILLSLTLTAAINFFPALQSTASARIELSEIDVQQVKIEQKGSTIIISGAQGKVAYIYNLIGVKLMTVQIDTAEKRIDISHLGKGIYPVKVGNISKKIYVSNR